LPIQSSRNK